MRVLVDAVLGPSHPRGVGRYVTELVAQIHRLGEAHVIVAIAPWHDDLFAPLIAAGADIEQVSVGVRRVLRNAWHAYGTGRLARRLGADLIHVPDRLAVIDAAGRPLVVTIHDTIEIDQPDAFGALQLRYRRWILRHQMRSATRVIAPSRFSALRIAALDPRAGRRTAVVMHGAGLDAGQAAEQPRQVPDGRRFVLFVGAVQRHKAVPLLVRAFRALDQGDLDLVIAGAEHNDEAAVTAAAGGDPCIVRVHDPSDGQLAWLYRNAVALVMPSRYEGFCLPLLEAMQLGCPVIAADAGAMPEICGDAALLFPPDDELALTDCLRRLLSDEAFRASMIRRGRERAGAFSWARAARETIAVYRAALGGDAPR